MAEQIVSHAWIACQVAEASTTMDHDDAILHVAGLTGYSVTTIEGVLASRQSLHDAAEVA